jgi:hypothetical protein
LKTWLIVLGIVTVLLAIGLAVLISVYNAWQTAAYVAIVILAIFELVSVLLLIALLAISIWAVLAIRSVTSDTVVPKVSQTLDQVRDSATAAKNTTAYVAESVASPLIKVASVAAGVRAAAITLARRNKPTGYEPK